VAQTFAAYSTATQVYQAYLHKHHIEQFRRRKYHPTGGVLQYLFTDSAPGVTCAIVDYWREPKLAYHVVKECYNPLYICADWPQGGYAPGGRLALRVYLINDRHQSFDGTWTWAIERDGAALTAQTRPAQLPLDSVTLPPEGLEWTVPTDISAGPAELVLTLDISGEAPVVNRYKFSIVPPQ
jgi:beta-mannosidase